MGSESISGEEIKESAHAEEMRVQDNTLSPERMKLDPDIVIDRTTTNRKKQERDRKEQRTSDMDVREMTPKKHKRDSMMLVRNTDHSQPS